YGAQDVRLRKTVVMAEGEYDKLLLQQIAGDLAGVATLGSQTNPLTSFWMHNLLDAEIILVAYDTDLDKKTARPKSERGAQKLLYLSPRIHPAIIPNGKDITEYWQAGGDLRAWLSVELAKWEKVRSPQSEIR